MSNITLPGTGVEVETVEGVGGAQRQVVQLGALPPGASTEATAAALLVAANAIKTAAETLAGRTINTSAVAGTVALDGATLAALESIQAAVTGSVAVTNFPANQPVSAVANLPTSNNATIFQFSSQNTSSLQLAAGATFPGVVETALDQPSISLLLTSDQPTTLTVRQFIDAGGTRAVPDIVFYIDANVGFSRSFTLNGNYVQVLAQNTGASATTTFSLNTAYGDLGDSESGGIMPVTELPLILAGAPAQAATVNNILTPVSGAAPVNIGGYRSASVQVVSTATGGAFIFEQSNDGINWVALPVFNAALVTAAPITGAITPTASAIIYTIPLRCSFFRLRISTTLTGGSIRAFTRISTEPWTATAQLVASNTAANMAVTVSGTVTANQGTMAALPAGANAVGDFGVQYRASATGGATPLSVLSPGTPVATVCKASAGRLVGLSLVNTAAALRSIKFWNAAQGSVTLGTTAALFEIDLAAGQSIFLALDGGIAFGTAITYAVTGAKGLTDNTGTLGLNDVSGALFFA